MSALAQFVTMLPPDAHAIVDDLARKLAPLSWPDRSKAFEGLWDNCVGRRMANAAFFAPGEAGPAPVFQAVVTATLERLRLRKIKNVDAAAWAFLSIHPEWRRSAEDFLRENAVAFVTWSAAHPLHDVIAAAIDEEAGRAPPAPTVN